MANPRRKLIKRILLGLFLAIVALIAIGMFSFSRETGLNPVTGVFCAIYDFDVNAGRSRDRAWLLWVKYRNVVYDRYALPGLYAKLIGPLPPPDWKYPSIVTMTDGQGSPENAAITEGWTKLLNVLEPDGFTKEQKVRTIRIFLRLARDNPKSARDFVVTLHRTIFPETQPRSANSRPNNE